MGCKKKGIVKQRVLQKLFCYVVIGVLIFSSIIVINFSEKAVAEDGTWHDDFGDIGDLDISEEEFEQYFVNPPAGEIKFYTNSEWDDPDWRKMQEITVDTGGDTYYDLILNLEVNYREGMEHDFKDLRFKRKYGTGWLKQYIESYEDQGHANVWIKVDQIGPSQNNKIYMFYDYDGVPQEYSGLDNVFGVNGNLNWNCVYTSHDKLLNTDNNPPAPCSRAYCPDVCYGQTNGNNEFLIVWSDGFERDLLGSGITYFQKELHGTIWDVDGGNSPEVQDKLIFKDVGKNYYRNENPSVAYGEDGWLVVWEHYRASDNDKNPVDSTKDIYAKFVHKEGDDFDDDDSYFTITDDPPLEVKEQRDPNVAYDSENDRYCVVWSDNRDGDYKHELIAALVDENGVIDEYELIDNNNKITYPWVAFDPIHKRYMIVWQEENSGVNNIKMRLFNEDLGGSWATENVADATGNIDFERPCVEFCEETQNYLVVYDTKLNNVYDKCYGVLYDYNGNLVDSDGTFTIYSGGTQYQNIVPYLTSHFMVSFEKTSSNKIKGVLVDSSNHITSGSSRPLTEELTISDSNSEAENANMGVFKNKIFVAWEDIRNGLCDTHPDIYSNNWYLYTDNDVTANIGDEVFNYVSQASITSKPIPTNSDVVDHWNMFYAEKNVNSGEDIIFDVLYEDGGEFDTHVTLPYDFQGLDGEEHIRLRATLSRGSATSTPSLGSWEVTYNGEEQPPMDKYEINIQYDPDSLYNRAGDTVNIEVLPALPAGILADIIIYDFNGEEIVNSSFDTYKNSYEWIVNDTLDEDGNYEAADGQINIDINSDDENIIINVESQPFKSIDNTPPKIESCRFDPELSGLIFNFSEPCQSVLYWGETADYGNTIINTATQENFIIPLDGLVENKNYFYKIEANDRAENNLNPVKYGEFLFGTEIQKEEEEEQTLYADANGPYEGHTGEVITFDGSGSKQENTSRDINGYLWDFDYDGTNFDIDELKADTTVNYSYKKVGKYTVALKVIDNHGSFDIDTTTAIISEKTVMEIDDLNDTTKFGIPRKDDTIVISVEVTPVRAIPDVKITINDHGNNKPDEGIPEPKAEDIPEKTDNFSVYRYVDIDVKSNNTYVYERDLESAYVIFRILKSWTEEENIDNRSVLLLRYNNSLWEQLTTTFLEDDGQYLTYISKTKGFSTFAVVGSEVVEQKQDDTENEPIPWVIIIGFIISAIIALVFILFKTKFIYIEDKEIEEKAE